MQIPIPRSTMNDLVLVTGERLAPLYERLRARIPSVEIVLADETSMRIQDRDKKGFIWVFHGQDDQGGELVLYVFATDRSSDTPKDVLGDSSGALVCDGYTGYNVVEDPEQRVRGGCWCHARRKFFEAKSTAPQEAERAISEIRELFRVEHEARLRGIVGIAEHLALRTARSKPVVDKLFEWLVEQKAGALPKSPLGAALTYMMNQRARLELFLTDPRVPLHNNASERRLRVVALGRKNYLFVGHPRAGRLIAGLYSLVGTCIANDVEPTAYLADVLTRIDDAKTDQDIDALLPDRWTPLGVVKTG
jgi:transposase